MEYINKAKTLVKDHAVIVGGAVAVAGIVAVYYLFARQKKYCKNCNAWISDMEPKCPYCNEKS